MKRFNPKFSRAMNELMEQVAEELAPSWQWHLVRPAVGEWMAAQGYDVDVDPRTNTNFVRMPIRGGLW